MCFECLSFCIVTGSRNMEGVSESRSGGQSSDLLLENIEKFILEYEDEMTSRPLTINKGKLYDTENLLEILEEKNKGPTRKPPDSVTAKRKETPIVPLKRKIENITKSDHPPKKIEVNTRKPSISVQANPKKPPVSPWKRKIELTNKSDIPPPKKIEVPTRKPSDLVPSNPKKTLIVPLKRRIENTTTTSDVPPKKIEVPTRKQSITVPANPKKPPVIPLKRKTEDTAKTVQCMRTRGRPKRPQIQHAKIDVIKEAKFEMAKPMPSAKKATERLHSCRTHTAKEAFVDIRNDSRVVEKNITIKEEVIDLTSEDVSLRLLIHYAREEVLPEIEYETCGIIEPFQLMSIQPFTDLHTATVYKPDVRVHLANAVIDLTHEDDDSSSIVVASEKECAIKILPALYKFHQTSQLNRLMEGALNEVGGTTLNFSSRSRQNKTIALTLIDTLSGLNVKNFKIDSFLGFLTDKFNQKYKVNVDRKCLAHYLQSMFVELNRQHCSNPFVTNFAKDVDEIVRIKCETEQSNTCENLSGVNEEVVFTETQLKELANQIRQYHLIVMYNQYIASSCMRPKQEGDFDMNRNELFAGSIAANPEVQREIKDEILELNGYRCQ